MLFALSGVFSNCELYYLLNQLEKAPVFPLKKEKKKGMARITIEDIERLGNTTNPVNISIFLPTHRYGHQVNEMQDQLLFKNQLQEVKFELEERGYQSRELTELLEPAYKLLDDTDSWRNMKEGLAVYISKDFFSSKSYPVIFKQEYFIAPEFIITPLLPMLSASAEFFILNLNQDQVKLYRADKFDIEEQEISEESMPANMAEVMKYYEFERHFEGKAMPSMNAPGFTTHGQREDIDKKGKYLQEYMNQVSNSIDKFVMEERIPMVLVGGEPIQHAFRNSSKYPELYPEGVVGNFTNLNTKDLHAKAWAVVKDHIERPLRNDFNKYRAWAGTGKTSYDLNNILQAAIGGRVDSICLDENYHVWGKVLKDSTPEIHKTRQQGDIDLANTIALQTILNGGRVQVMEQHKLPENETDVNMTAVYRY